MRRSRLLWLPLTGAMLLNGCSHQAFFDSSLVEEPRIAQTTRASELLQSLPAPTESTAVSVYDFQDQTGQFKPNERMTDYSRAITQGGLAILLKALVNAGNGEWFTVVERGGLQSLMQERQIIRMMRDQYQTPDGQHLGELPPLLYAGLLIEGGIVGYDSNIVTGGAGAKYLGVGGNVDYRRDIVTVDLRAVSIATGQVLLTVTSEKTIYSSGITGSVFKYVAVDELLEMETGFTLNEPPQLAVRQAIETAVYAMVMEGARKGLWQFRDPEAGQQELAEYSNKLTHSGKKAPVPSEKPASATGSPVSVPSLPAAASEKAAPQAEADEKSFFDKIFSFGSEEKPAESYPVITLPKSR